MRLASVFVLVTVLVTALFAVAAPRAALAVDHNFAGSAQLDYHFVPTAKGGNARGLGFDGFTLEAAGKVTVDFSEHLSANIKICFGCHGFEADMAYFDYSVADELTLRFGRFSPTFGSFNIRHDPANHRLSDKPLPYDMGRMLRLRAWNMGVLPSPFPDNGAELNGKHAFGGGFSMDYAAYAVSGFKGDAGGTDIDFSQSRDGNLYYVDNNGRPTFGGHLAFTLKLGDTSDATLGASVMRGNFDPKNDLSYTIVGGDLVFRLDRTNVRLEYLARRQELDVSDPTRFRYEIGSNGNFFVKHGAYAEIEQPVTSAITLVGRADGMLRVGNVPALPAGTPLPADGVLGSRSSVIRYTLGAAFSVERSLTFKASGELWQFSDKDASGQTIAASMHLAAVGTF